jgi:serine phosphatase RsbU (regulator of sigma subunit)
LKTHRTIVKSVLLVILVSQILFLKAQNNNQDRERDAHFRTVFLYSFTRFFKWTNLDQLSEFRFGLVGADSAVVSELKQLALKKKVQNLPITIVSFNSPESITQVEVLLIDMAKFPKYKMPPTSRNTLIVSQNSGDIYNTMIAFIEREGKLKFAFNKRVTEKAGLAYNPDFEALADVVVGRNDRRSDDAEEIEKWKSVFEKMNFSLNTNNADIKLSKTEVRQVVGKLEEQRTGLETKEKILNELEQELTKKEKNLIQQRGQINRQESDIIAQKNKIDEQLNSIISQEQKIALQGKKLALTIEQNKLQQKELDWKKFELLAQEKKRAAQKGVLDAQKKDIEKQKQVLLVQLDQINTQKIILWLSASVVLIVILALGIVFWSYKKTQRINILLELQKNEITQQNTTIKNQKNLVEEQHKEITDSINYAQRIQRSLLPSDVLLKTNLPDHFVFFQPKDIVSGDFYWGSVLNNGLFALAIADSTGHGVPGAIMSMLNIACLNESVEAGKLTEPNEILNNTRKRIIEHLANDGSEQGGKDGMDCSLISFDFTKNRMYYSGANNPVWITRLNATNSKYDLIELEPDKMPVGKHDKDVISFSQKTFDLKKSDMVFAFTDGMPDQFGGPKGKKYMYKKLKELLTTISSQPLNDQKVQIAKSFAEWKGEHEQVDDVCVVGIRVRN